MAQEPVFLSVDEASEKEETDYARGVYIAVWEIDRVVEWSGYEANSWSVHVVERSLEE